MHTAVVTLALAATGVAALAGSASAQQPASGRASCVAVITSYEASQLPPGSVGTEVSGLASDPGLGAALVSPLARVHPGSLEACHMAE
ncbi:MAG TPA: hypothetical protein VH279_05780 [Solirubrobacteraceae bacterium]|nr:hypothetical protein [Solirubrobacteraceae bacterium]